MPVSSTMIKSLADCFTREVIQCLTSSLEQPIIFNRSCNVACDNMVDGQNPALRLVWYWYGEYIPVHFFNPFQLMQEFVHEEEQYHQVQ